MYKISQNGKEYTGTQKSNKVRLMHFAISGHRSKSRSLGERNQQNMKLCGTGKGDVSQFSSRLFKEERANLIINNLYESELLQKLILAGWLSNAFPVKTGTSSTY